MQSKWIIVAAALAAGPIGLVAQGTPRPPRPPRVRTFAFSDHRGRIGVIVQTDASADTDKLGAKIEGVTPGGPADKAGIKVVDIITKFSGTSLAGVKAEDEDESGPCMKLVQLARKLEPDDTVQVEFRRGTESKKATLVAEDMGMRMEMRMPQGPEIAVGPMAGMMDHWELLGSPWGDLKLVSLNADLGEYFGAKEGVLVVKAPADSTLALKGGDVITAIGGRKPSSPEHAMRILRSYDPGDTVSVNVLRKKKAITVTWVVPEREDHFYKMAPHMREEPGWFELAPELRRQIEIPELKIREMIRTTRAI